MSTNGELYLSAFVTVLVVMDPLGNIPIFLALTRNQTPAARNRSALVGSAVAAGVIVSFAVVGRQLLDLLGISFEALQVAGGLLLLIIALELLRGDSSALDETEGDAGIALVPLGTPLLAGPGAIAATMVYIGEADGPSGAVVVVAALLSVIIIVFLALRFSGLIARVIRDSGIVLLSRIVGLLAAAIAVQLIANAIQVWVDEGVT
ncbi:MAG: MarC family protein [Acidimicrobiia bacterium]|nr:MarC family protein [Acidimicrobiia bacterium]